MNNQKQIILTALGVSVTFAFLLIAYFMTNTPSKPLKEMMTIKATDHSKWSPAKKHILVEYSDLQCPACKTFHELLNSFESSTSANYALTKNITLVYRHFPLYQIHPLAFESAYAAEAAGKQGKFFEYLDKVFADQNGLDATKDVKKYHADMAKKLKLDLKKFEQDRASEETKKIVQSSLSEGEAAGIPGTPTFFLDGVQMNFTSAQDFIDQLKAVK